MRILHVIPSLDPTTGGPPRIAARLASAQAALGHEVELLSYRVESAVREIEEELATIPGANRVNWTFVDTPSRLEGLLAHRARKRLLERTSGTDFIYLHSIWNPVCRVAASVARRARVPYAILVNGMLDPWSLSQRSLKKRLAMALGYRRMVNKAAFLHLGNEDERRLIEPLGLRCPNDIIPNGVFLEEVDPLPQLGGFRKAHRELGDAPYILFLSRLHYKKGLDVLADAYIRVASERPDVHLVVAGPDGGAKADFERRISIHPSLIERVHLVGSLQGKQRFEAMVDSHCFCLPSRQEGFSMAITESIASGTAVVITEGCHFPEIETAGAGRVVELSGEAVASALLEVLREKNPRERYGTRGRELVRTCYTWSRIAEQTLTAYHRFTAGTARA